MGLYYYLFGGGGILSLVATIGWIWMLVDAARNGEWGWFFLMLFFFPSAFYYFFYHRSSMLTTRGFELPGAGSRRRIKELESQIHHLDKAHHYLELGDIYFRKGQ